MLVKVLKLKTDCPCLSNSGCIATGTLQKSDNNSHYAEQEHYYTDSHLLQNKHDRCSAVQNNHFFCHSIVFHFFYVLIKIPHVNS